MRVLTVSFAALADSSEGFDVALGIGFLGLLLSLVVLCGLLLTTVFGDRGPGEAARMRELVLTLAAIGSVVATLLSLTAHGSDESDVEGGAGAIMVLLGVVACGLIVSQQTWKDVRSNRW